MLDSLPPEILHTILCDVGSDTLRAIDTCGLTVSKRWNSIAQPIVFEKLVLSATQFIGLPRWSEMKMKRHTRELTIVIKGLESENRHWVDLLKRYLDRLSVILPACSQLRSFNLRIQSHLNADDPLEPPLDFLTAWSPISLVKSLSLSRIRHLELDSCGSELQSTDHVCPMLATAIPSLFSIRLRMRTICPRVLSLCAESESTTIENIVINLSLLETAGWPTAWSRHCETRERDSEIFERMVEAGTAFAHKYRSVQSLRILCYFHPGLQILEHDCVTGVERPLTHGIQDMINFDWTSEIA